LEIGDLILGADAPYPNFQYLMSISLPALWHPYGVWSDLTGRKIGCSTVSAVSLAFPIPKTGIKPNG
jgi:hypothetical protein